MLYLIGLGLNEKAISLDGLEACKTCNKVYLESYTTDFPYHAKRLEKLIGKKLEILSRDKVESDFLVREAKNFDVALLVYGSPLFATTHLALLDDCKKNNIKTEVIHNASVFEAIAETGLELYKFGKITSMPRWSDNFKPSSFLDVVEENQSIKAHSLILSDIGLKFEEALKQLEAACIEKNFKLEKIIVASCLGTKNKRFFYGTLESLKKIKGIKNPFCIIIPSKLHFLEEESLEKFSPFR